MAARERAGRAGVHLRVREPGGRNHARGALPRRGPDVAPARRRPDRGCRGCGRGEPGARGRAAARMSASVLRVRFGLIVPQGWREDLEGRDFETMVAVARHAEERGYDSIWLYDHLQTRAGDP